MPPKQQDETTTTDSSSTSAKTTTTRSTRYFGGWADIPEWSDKPGECYFFDCPSEILDQILSQPILSIRDHLSLAATCRALRASYYTPQDPLSDKHPSSPLWTALLDLRPLPRRGLEQTRAYREHIPVKRDATSSRGRSYRTAAQDRELDEKHESIISKICSGTKVGAEKMEILWRREDGRVFGVRSCQWELAMDKTGYRIEEDEARFVYCLTGSQYHGPHPAFRSYYRDNNIDCTNMEYEIETTFFHEAAVEALALRLHGGPEGHKAFVAKVEAMRRAKKKAAMKDQ
ncbi:hypothetical protein MNV49_004855 [Pseudohyphozyma bogoriensis]|nr:hypothetical protein MNV49_004855 [Pseudohyphozyma bogoriensis]